MLYEVITGQKQLVAADTLEKISADYPLSIHGVGLSLGGSEPLDLRNNFV